MNKADRERRELQHTLARLLEKTWLGIYLEVQAEVGNGEKTQELVNLTCVRDHHYWLKMADRLLAQGVFLADPSPSPSKAPSKTPLALSNAGASSTSRRKPPPDAPGQLTFA